MNNMSMNPQNKNLMIMAGVALAGMYGSYLYGQKNPKRNVLDMSPREMGQRAQDRLEENKNYLKEAQKPDKKGY